MTNSLPLNTVFLIAGTIFLFIAVIGRAKLGFAEINPGCFGRLLGLILGLFCLILAVSLAVFPSETWLEIIRNFVTLNIQ
jgi:hypothetical protein